jgi:hypothetical protein
MKKLKLILSVLIALSLLIVFALPIHAANPTVSITVTAKVIAITNTQDTWAIGTIVPDAVVYFSATGAQDDDYSTITNTGNVSVDIEIQGTNIEGGDYDWTLANDGTAGSEIYALHAWDGADYTIVVKSADYVDIETGLAASGTYTWSMKFTAPTAFNASDDGVEKTATVTLVASEAA